jgi:NADPH:quinone reductase-like Zn-dependent oxidoreductase
MRALVLSRYGGPEHTSLTDVPQPSPRAGEFVVRVHAAGLNPVDYKTRAGALRVIRKYPLPIVMGNELSGVVEAVGPGVMRFVEGERVFARVDKDAMGAFAEYAVVHKNHAARMPAVLDFASAAAVPLAALTALQALRDELHPTGGEHVFIPGGAGGAGAFAFQIAKHLGARVATTASPRGEALVKRLGADVVIDYTRERFEDKLSGYDFAFDLLGGETLAGLWSVLKPGGRVVSIARRVRTGDGAKRSGTWQWPGRTVLGRQPDHAAASCAPRRKRSIPVHAPAWRRPGLPSPAHRRQDPGSRH